MIFFPVLVLTKINAFIGRPVTEEMGVKQMQGELQWHSNKVLELSWLTLFFILDHVDLCSLIIIHKLKKDYANNNNFDYVAQSAYERIYCDYYDKYIVSNSKKKQKKTKMY